ncbi:Calmegin [Quillaja saponaria]|uniref:Calmegin n=1 Tax=Quillaja saponaria TaxID=32244 RepID=A0AAD7VG37_QUISA|nr:Calmegin [Quillaja saponaria]
MRRSCFLSVLLVSSLLVLSFSHGSGRILTETVEHENSAALENARNSKEMIGMMDYDQPEPNTNPRNGYIFGPPPQPN